MKKLFLVLASCLVFFGCNYIGPTEIILINNSSYDFSFTQPKDPTTYTSLANTSMYIPVKTGCYPKLTFLNNEPVYQIQSGNNTIKIFDLNKYELHIKNSSDSNISFSVNNSPYTKTITVPAKSEINNTYVYTPDPIITCEYKYYYLRKEGDIFYLMFF